jgi:hypothetical protein
MPFKPLNALGCGAVDGWEFGASVAVIHFIQEVTILYQRNREWKMGNTEQIVNNSKFKIQNSNILDSWSWGFKPQLH